MSFAERLLKKKLETEVKIKQQREEKERNELIGCTFHPNIQNTNNNSSLGYYSNNVYNNSSGGNSRLNQYKRAGS